MDLANGKEIEALEGIAEPLRIPSAAEMADTMDDRG
jgi:hypothetical protein